MTQEFWLPELCAEEAQGGNCRLMPRLQKPKLAWGRLLPLHGAEWRSRPEDSSFSAEASAEAKVRPVGCQEFI
jgi:hypothetical protein